MEQLLGRQSKLSNRDSIHSLFLFTFFLLLSLFLFFFIFLFYGCDENSNSVLTLFVSVFRIK